MFGCGKKQPKLYTDEAGVQVSLQGAYLTG